MEKIETVAAQADFARDVKEEAEGGVRALQDLELMLVGGGDGTPGWP